MALITRRPTMNAKHLHKLLTQIALDHLFVETLDTRHHDDLDFHDVSVWALKSALEAAFEAGRQEALKSTSA
jgi:hypothetical protein